MKRIIFLIALLFTISAISIATKINAICPPSWTVTSGNITSCPGTPSQSATWLIEWQDGTSDNVGNSAFGRCCSHWWAGEFTCRPNWDEPYVFPTSLYDISGSTKAAAGWKHTAYERGCDGDGCRTEYIKTVERSRICPPWTEEGSVCSADNQDRCENECGNWDSEYCVCRTARFGECGNPQVGCNCSPILIDTAGDGFVLTRASQGVSFDLNGDGTRLGKFGWTLPNTNDAWLVMDRNGNGLIDNGSELFGNYTPQPNSPQPHGFLALAEIDKLNNGGNQDGIISNQDDQFNNLRLWLDSNHNGNSEIIELKTLQEMNIAELELDYKESKRKDEFGNRFRYRAKVRDQGESKVGRWAWDVFLVWTEN